jgi:sugar phosphate permease
VLILIFGIVVGFVDCMGIITGIILEDYGYSDSDAAVFGLFFLLGGILGSIIFGCVVEKFKNYRAMIIVTSFFTTIAPMTLLQMLPSENIWYCNLSVASVGFFGFALLPIAVDFGVELTYPVPESVIVGLVMTAEQVFCLIFSFLSSFLIEGKKENHAGVKISAAIFCAFLCVATLLGIFLIKEDLKRIKFQKEQESKE